MFIIYIKSYPLPLVTGPYTSYRRPKYISYRCVRIPYAHDQATSVENKHIVNIHDMVYARSSRQKETQNLYLLSLVTWGIFFWCDTGLAKQKFNSSLLFAQAPFKFKAVASIKYLLLLLLVLVYNLRFSWQTTCFGHDPLAK